MVGYALSTASAEGYTHMLITAFDSDDFTFVDDATPASVYRYSRITRDVEQISGTSGDIPYREIYWLAEVIRSEERKWSFPVALVWSAPEFGNREILGVEFQNTWPSKILFTSNPGYPYINITSIFSSGSLRPLQSAFICEILNNVMYEAGIYISEGFCECTDSLFCDYRVALIFEKLTKTKIFTSLLSETGNKIAMAQCGKADCHIDSVKVRDTLKAATSKGRQRCRNITMHGDLINIRNQCIFDCLDILYMFFDEKTDADEMWKEFAGCIRTYLEAVVSMKERLYRDYVIDRRSDIYYMTFDDLLSVFAFAQEKTDLKAVVRTLRRKSSIARKNKAPDIVLPDGEFIYLIKNNFTGKGLII